MSGILCIRAIYWRGLFRLTFMPHSAKNESVSSSILPFPGKARRTLFLLTAAAPPYTTYQRFYPCCLLLAGDKVAHRHYTLTLLIFTHNQRQRDLSPGS